MKKVNAIILGAQKCATTTLFDLLRQSRDVEVSLVKETNFFSGTSNWREDLPRYHALFQHEAPVMLEASPSYTVYPHNREIWRDMYEYNPELRFIYLVRPPLDRMKSAYRHTYERGYTDKSYEDFLLYGHWAKDCTRYAFQIAPFIETFGRDAVLILNFDDVVKNQVAVLRQVAEFLGIEPSQFDVVKPMRSNDGTRRKYHHRFDAPALPLRVMRKFAPGAFTAWRERFSPVPPGDIAAPLTDRQAFLDYVSDDIDELEKLTGWNLSDWRKP